MKYILHILTFVILAFNQLPSYADSKAIKATETIVPTASASVPANRLWTATEYRNSEWQPDVGKYFFSEMWRWSFGNRLYPEDHPQRYGHFSIMVDPPSGTMLLTREESNYLDEMTEWIIVQPNGEYILGWTEHTGEKFMKRHSIADFDDHAFRSSEQAADFDKYFTHVGEYLTYGEDVYGWRTFKGKEYKQTYMKSSDISYLTVTTLPFSIRPLYLVEKINQDLKLPIKFSNYAYLLPENALALGEFYGKEFVFNFESASHTSSFLDISEYVEITR